MYKAEILLTGGMNLDADILFTKQVRFRLNSVFGSTDGENLGAVENMKGNTLVNFQLPAGTNKCIGGCEDLETDSIVFFVYNSNKEYVILVE